MPYKAVTIYVNGSHLGISLYYLEYIPPGAYEPPEGRKERPTLHYSVERHLILNAINTSLIWTYPQVVMSGVVFIANAHRVYVYSTL